jgi:hypothetical protein
LKIYTNLLPKAPKYLTKNTVNARFNRHLDVGTLSALGTGVQIARMPNWQIPDIGITSMFASVSIKNLSEAVKDFIALKPIRKRALSIKNCNKKTSAIALNNKA